MGYYTQYRITSPDLDGAELDAALGSLGYFGSIKGGEWTSEVKWYEHQEDIKQLSLRFPGVVFVVDGNGEGRDYGEPDIWRAYCKDGHWVRFDYPTWTPPPCPF